jgi:hypothetical protein
MTKQKLIRFLEIRIREGRRALKPGTGKPTGRAMLQGMVAAYEVSLAKVKLL